MSDLRIEYLKLTDNRPSTNSAVVASIFMYVTMVGLALEKDNTKSIPLRLWLVGVIIQTVVQSSLKVFQGRMRGMGNAITHEEIATINRTVDNIELASYVWFALGNILFLESQDCRSESPFVYFLCVMYFSVSYAALFTFHIVQISLIVKPPSRTEDRLYWMQNRFVYPENDVDELIPTLREYPVYANTSISAKQAATGLTDQQTLFWTEWLASYGCRAGQYKATGTLRADGGANPSYTLDNSSTDANQTHDVLNMSLNTAAPQADHELKTDSTKSSKSNVLCMADEELCSICLLELTTPPTPAPSTPRTPLNPRTSRTPSNQATFPTTFTFRSFMGPSIFYCANCAAPSDVRRTDSTVSSVYDNIVRYPCKGQHYFHVPCLHRWMQSATERKWDVSGRERLVFARCPYCCQAPST